MITPILVGVCVVIGLVLLVPVIFGYDSITEMFKGKEAVDKLPPVMPMPSGPTPEVEVELVPVAPVKPARSKLAYIVSEWEDFVNVLVDNGMQESAEDMKSLLNKMVDEYRNDLNEDDKDESVASIDSIIAPAEKGE